MARKRIREIKKKIIIREKKVEKNNSHSFTRRQPIFTRIIENKRQPGSFTALPFLLRQKETEKVSLEEVSQEAEIIKTEENQETQLKYDEKGNGDKPISYERPTNEKKENENNSQVYERYTPPVQNTAESLMSQRSITKDPDRPERDFQKSRETAADNYETRTYSSSSTEKKRRREF